MNCTRHGRWYKALNHTNVFVVCACVHAAASNAICAVPSDFDSSVWRKCAFCVEVRLTTHVELIRNKPKWINLFFNSIILDTMECGISVRNKDVLLAYIWLNFFSLVFSLLFFIFTILSRIRNSSSHYYSAWAMRIYSRLHVPNRWHAGVAATCANQSNIEIYTWK